MSALLQKKIDEHLQWLRQRADLPKSQNSIIATVTRAANQNQLAAEALPLGMILADEIGQNGYEPSLEIVEGLLTEGALSMIYGDSNTGKTFLALDLACAVARGIEWMGRRTVPGLVIYVAAESPSSVRGRLYAYQMHQHHKCKLENLVVVQHPVNLLADSDVGGLIEAIRLVEDRVGQKAQMIVGDTLARMTIGANENSVEDMGLALANCDAVRRATGAHFCLIHHCGKNSEKGPRGHTSLRAAVDTEIQVALVEGEDGAVIGRQARVTKQRDLPVGESIDFDLRVLEIGKSQWGGTVTSCVVMREGSAPPEKTYQAPVNEIKDQGQKPKGRHRQVKKISLEEGWELVNQNGFDPDEWRLPAESKSQECEQEWKPIVKPINEVT